MTKLVLGDIQETLLIPLYGRAVETRKPDGLLRDAAAVGMVAALDYDFSRFDGKPSLQGACLRTLHFDQWVKQFLAQNPTGTVIELGVGLNTRYERLSQEFTKARCIELDLPDSMSLRRRFFAERPNRHFISASVTDPGWLDILAEFPGPYCFCSEAMLLFLPEPDVREVLALIAARFPGSLLLLDTISPLIHHNQGLHDIIKLMKASFAWSIPHPADLANWGPYELLETLTLYELLRPQLHRFPLSLRLGITLARYLYPPLVASYRLNRVRIG